MSTENRESEGRCVVVVGEPWPEGPKEIEVEEINEAREGDTKVVVANRLALGAALLVVGFAVFAILRDDRALQDRIYNLAEWTILFALSWIAGHTAVGRGGGRPGRGS